MTDKKGSVPIYIYNLNILKNFVAIFLKKICPSKGAKKRQKNSKVDFHMNYWVSKLAQTIQAQLQVSTIIFQKSNII